MDQAFTQSPFAVLTLIVAPAMLTNASSVLAMSTINRMLRTRDRMAQLLAKSEQGQMPEEESGFLLEWVSRVEKQAVLLLRALHAIYIALGAFAGATLVTLLGAGLAPLADSIGFRIFATAGIVLGCLGVGSLIFGSMNLFHATRLSLINIREEAEIIRKRQRALLGRPTGEP